MRAVRVSVLVAVLLLAGHSSAYTECSDREIGYVLNDGQNTYLGPSSTGHLRGVIRNTNPQYDQLIAIVLAARVASLRVTIRYEQNDLNCSSIPWNATIVGVGL